ncbi:twin-arginine translocation pathway signal protein [Helicobacter didelphidarum]|uniref:Twin-arginine translocation pathway signal protein n=1 Tax=Helicobacter didelphidarum TaxID=2040648 RepID=A0A3D8ID29_9HELI|nr:ABC transporter substrate-binding protein [Helicobacter didelphidarum]RDU63113.1 twin-arginine translocation pathway signal protein [Helicobacter didelphidarum]
MESTRRSFLIKSSFVGMGLIGAVTQGVCALDFESGFKMVSTTSTQDSVSMLKIGYLPITDHLLILSGSLPNATINYRALRFSSWADLAQTFSSGSLDAAFILAPLALKIYTQGIKMKAIMATHRHGSALVVGKNSHIDSYEKLKGAKIAIPSRFSIHYILLCELLTKNHIDLNGVKFIDMSPPEMVYSLSRNAIDGFIVAEPFAFQAERLNVGRVFVLTKDIRANHACCILCVNEQLYNDKESLKNLVDTFSNGVQFIYENPSQAAEISKQFLGQKPNLIDALLREKDRITYTHLKLQDEEIQEIAKNAQDLKLGQFKIEGFLDSDFVR